MTRTNRKEPPDAIVGGTEQDRQLKAEVWKEADKCVLWVNRS